jgi:tetratricopeptide (TPR) repeat protein
LGYAYALSGRITDGVPLLERANEQSQAIGRKGGWALRLTWLAHASLLEGRIVAAREHCQRALALAGAGGERGYQAWALKVLGDIVQEEGAGPSEALDHYSASMKLATELAMRPLQAHIHLSRGRLYSREKQVEKARTELSLALTSYRSMEMPFWLNAAEHELNTLVH